MDLNMWQCDCGKIEYGELPPSECESCWNTNSFVEVPEDMRDELGEGSLIENIRSEDDEDEEDEEDE